MAPSKNDREARIARERLRAYQARQAVHETGKKRRRRDNLIAGVAIVVIAAAAIAAQLAYFGVGPGKPTAKSTAAATATASPTPSPTGTGVVPDKSVAQNRDWTGTLTLNKDIPLGVTIDGKAAPQAASVVISLAKSNFYTGTVCHRLTTGATFKVLQCGGAKTVAAGPTGNAGFSFGPIENAPKADSSGNAVYKKGTIAMARASGDANSNGSQFFIVYGDTTIPNDSAGGYTVVGTVTSGLDTLISTVTSKGSDNSNGTDDGVPKVATTITGFSLK